MTVAVARARPVSKACKQGLGNGNGPEKKELSIFQCGTDRAS